MLQKRFNLNNFRDVLFLLLFIPIHCSMSQQLGKRCASSSSFFSDNFESYTIGGTPSQGYWEFINVDDAVGAKTLAVTNRNCVTENGKCLMARRGISTQIGCYENTESIYIQLYAYQGLDIDFLPIEFSFVTDSRYDYNVRIETHATFSGWADPGGGPSGFPQDLLYLSREDSNPNSWYRFEFKIKLTGVDRRMRLRIYENRGRKPLIFGPGNNTYDDDKMDGIVSARYASSSHDKNTGDIYMNVSPKLKSNMKKLHIRSSRLDDFVISNNPSILEVGFDSN